MMEADNLTKYEFAIEMNSPCCKTKVETALTKFPGIKKAHIDVESQRLVFEGDVIAEDVRKAIEHQTGLSTVILGVGNSQIQNFGAAVAAIRFGPSNVKGLLRMVQTSKDICLIEGSLDYLPSSKNLFVSLHELGDVTDGCESCGDPFIHKTKTGTTFNGVLANLSVEDDQSARFKVTTSEVSVSDMIGRCVVIHEGETNHIQDHKSKRLACGLVARASGLFENSKRFCACDGITIWEEKKKWRDTEEKGKL